MNKTQIAIIILAITLIAGCSKRDNEFIVVDAKNTALSAILEICDESVNLSKVREGFSKKVPIACEGEGSIRVHLKSNHEVTCPVGYVTPGAEQIFRFVIENGQCR